MLGGYAAVRAGLGARARRLGEGASPRNAESDSSQLSCLTNQLSASTFACSSVFRRCGCDELLRAMSPWKHSC